MPKGPNVLYYKICHIYIVLSFLCLIFCVTFSSVHFIVKASCLSIHLNMFYSETVALWKWHARLNVIAVKHHRRIALISPVPPLTGQTLFYLSAHCQSQKQVALSSPPGQVPPERRPFLPAGILTVNLSLRDFWELCQIFPPWIAF